MEEGNKISYELFKKKSSGILAILIGTFLAIFPIFFEMNKVIFIILTVCGSLLAIFGILDISVCFCCNYCSNKKQVSPKNSKDKTKIDILLDVFIDTDETLQLALCDKENNNLRKANDIKYRAQSIVTNLDIKI